MPGSTPSLTRATSPSTHFNGSSPGSAYLRPVKDCEAIRKSLTKDYPPEKRKWSVMGQSFGGFCCVHYLSRYPEGLQEVFITGGLPPLVKDIDVVYRHLYSQYDPGQACSIVKVRSTGKVAERNNIYYAKYPEDVRRVKDIIRHVEKGVVTLPSGGRLSVLRLRQLGMLFGSHGESLGIQTIDMICHLTSDLTQFGFFTRQSLSAFESVQPFDDAPLRATKWSADRVMITIPEFINTSPDGNEPVFFTGEMIHRSMFDDYAELVDLKETADILAYTEDWPDLYDEEQLAKNKVPVYAAIYIEDMYVHFGLALETALKIKNCKNFITNIMYHDAISHRTDELMRRLFDLRDDTLD
ncbi:MAG: hypothetical protein Q9163_000790 [Psora crenata]